MIAVAAALPVVTLFGMEVRGVRTATTAGDSYYRDFGAGMLYLLLGAPLTWLLIPFIRIFGPFDYSNDWWVIAVGGALLMVQWVLWAQVLTVLKPRVMQRDRKPDPIGSP